MSGLNYDQEMVAKRMSQVHWFRFLGKNQAYRSCFIDYLDVGLSQDSQILFHVQGASRWVLPFVLFLHVIAATCQQVSGPPSINYVFLVAAETYTLFAGSWGIFSHNQVAKGAHY